MPQDKEIAQFIGGEYDGMLTSCSGVAFRIWEAVGQRDFPKRPEIDYRRIQRAGTWFYVDRSIDDADIDNEIARVRLEHPNPQRQS